MVSHGERGRNPSGGAKFISVGPSPEGCDIRLQGKFPGPLRVIRPNERMRQLGCNACFRRHDNRNLACAGSTGIKPTHRPRGVYALKSGVFMGWRLKRIDSTGHAWLTLFNNQPPHTPMKKYGKSTSGTSKNGHSTSRRKNSTGTLEDVQTDGDDL